MKGKPWNRFQSTTVSRDLTSEAGADRQGRRLEDQSTTQLDSDDTRQDWMLWDGKVHADHSIGVGQGPKPTLCVMNTEASNSANDAKSGRTTTTIKEVTITSAMAAGKPRIP